MASPDLPSTASARPDARPAAALAAVLLLGLVARVQVTLLPDVVVGEDGAYYLIQVRAILRDGHLALPDLPLLFYTQAAVAWFLALIAEPRAAVVAAVRSTDTIIPLLLAVPVYRFARSFAGAGDAGSRAALAVLLVGPIAVASATPLGMAGGVIKNAAALPFSLLFAAYLHQWLRHGEWRALGRAALCLVVSSLTHLGGLALSASIGGLVVAVGLLAPGARARALPPALGLLACLASIVGLVRVADADRAARLLHATVHPGWLLADSPVSRWLRGDVTPLIANVLASEEVWLGNALGLIGLYALWRHRGVMDPATRVVIAGMTMTALCFSSPLLRPDVSERLAMMAYVPGLVPATYLICRTWRGSWLVAPLTVLAMIGGALAVKTLRVTALVRPAFEELERLKAALPPGRNIVITRPLLRWWVVWSMDVDFSSRAGPALGDRDAYDAVLVLDEIRQGAFGQAHVPLGGGAPGVGVRDAVLLRSETVTTLAEGKYFRLSRVERGHDPPAVHRVGYQPKDGRRAYDYNWLGIQHTTIAAKQPLAAGKSTIRLDFAYDGGGMGKGGTGTLFVNGLAVHRAHPEGHDRGAGRQRQGRRRGERGSEGSGPAHGVRLPIRRVQGTTRTRAAPRYPPPADPGAEASG